MVHFLEERELTMPRKRYFTVEEANQLIPKLEQYIGSLKSLRLELEAVGAILTPLFEIVHYNGGHPKTPKFIQAVSQFHEIVERIHSHGCLLKGLDEGLIDFPHLRKGREVYLCWKSGEKEIRYWHDLEAGAAGRKPL